MADVANSISTSPQGRSNSYVTSPCSSSSALVSPNIVEAIDRIFPKSPSQLLPDSICNRRTSLGGLPQSQSNVISSLPCTVSMDLFTTDTTTTATAVFTGLTSSSGTKSPLMSSTPTSQMDLPSLPAQTKVNQVSCLKNGTIDISHKKSDVPNDFIALKKKSKADLEITNNLSPKNGKSERCSLPEKEFGDLNRQEISDSDDMCRPFVQLQKEKKKKKRKHMKSNNQRKDLVSGEISDPSVTPPVTPKISKLTIVHPATTPGQSNEDDYRLRKSQHSALTMSPENGHRSDLNSPSTNPTLNEKGESLPDSLSDPCFFVPSSVNTNILDVKNSGYVKDNKWIRRQKLPKARRRKYHVGKDIRQIQSTFLPCFVVLRSMSGSDLQGSDNGCSTAMDLSIKERVKTLSTLCAQSKFECILKKKSLDDVLSYKNFMDNSQCSNSEDEFRIPQGRSLRKRRQDICYVEPSEDDLLEDLSLSSRKKRSGQSKKDSSIKSDPLDEDQSPKEISPKKNVDALASPVQSEPPEKKIKKKLTASSNNEDIVFLCETTLSKENNKSSVQPEPNQKTPINSLSMKEGVGKKDSATVSTGKAASGPNLVYVYPKKKVVRSHSRSSFSGSVLTSGYPGKSLSAANDKVAKGFSPAQSVKPGPASNNRPPDVVSLTPVTTQSMATTSKNMSAIPFPLGFSGTPLAASSLAQNLPNLTTNTNLSSFTLRNNALPSNLCMVKIDGKDYLLSMPASNNVHGPASTQLTSTSAAAIPFPPPSLMSAPGQRFMFYQSSSGVVPALRPAGLAQGIVTTKVGNPTFTIPQLPTAVTLPGRVGSNAIHLLPSSAPSPSLLSTPLLASTRVSASSITSVATSSTQNRLSSSVSSTAQSSSTTRTSISVPKPTSSNLLTVTSGVVSSSLQTSAVSTAVTTSLPARQVRSLVGPLIAPGSTTVIRHHPGQSTATSSSVQLVTPNASVSGARCFRIIVPGCSAPGSTARIATLGTSALSSPLTRLSASSSLLPQRKHNADKEMSPEKRAAKRRRLEKKYPLPPGVVIKTEPLDSPQTSLTIQAGSVRSLLSPQNIQLITAASRAGVSGVQRFRIISPSAPGVVVGSRPVRFGSNVIIRAPVISPPSSRPTTSASSLVQLTTSASSLMSQSSSPSVTVNTPTVSSASLDTAVTTTTTSSLSMSVSTASRGTISLLSPGTLLLSSATTSAYPVPTSSILVSSVSSSTVVTTSTLSRTTLTSAQVSTLSSTQPISVSSPAEAVSVCNAISVDSSLSSTPAVETGSQEDQPAISNVPDTSQAGSAPANNCEGSVADIVTMRQNVEKLEKLISGQEALGLKGARLDKLKELLSQKRSALSELEQEEGEPQSESNGSEEGVVDMGATAEDPVVID